MKFECNGAKKKPLFSVLWDLQKKKHAKIEVETTLEAQLSDFFPFYTRKKHGKI
jgi:hypothetical protein